MKSSYLTNLILLIVIAGLFWFSQKSSTTNNTEVALSDIKADEINSILITRTERPEIKLSKHTTGWQLTQPISTDGNKTRIDLLLSLLSSTIHSQLNHPSDEMLKQLGLKPAILSLKLNEQLFVFGGIEPIDKRRYVLFNDTVYLIDDLVAPLLNVNATSFIDNRLFPLSDQVHKLQLPLLKDSELDASSNITISNQAGIWESVPIGFSKNKLASVVASWQQAAALQVTQKVLDKSDQNDSVAMQVWFNEAAIPVEFIIRIDNRSLYITNIEKQLNYHFPAALAQQLFLPLAESD